MTRDALYSHLTKAGVLTALLAFAPLRDLSAQGGQLKFDLDPRLKYSNDGFIRRTFEYDGFDRQRNLVWEFNPADGSQNACPAPTANAGLSGLISVWHGNVIVAESNVGKIWKVNPLTCAGQEYKPSYSFTGQLGAMDRGPDKKVWIVVNTYAPSQSAIIRFDPMTNTFEDPYPFSGTPIADIKKYGSNMVVTNVGANELDQISPSWTVSRFKLPGTGFGSIGGWIAESCTNTLWFTYGYYVGALNTNNIYLYDTPFPGQMPYGIAQDAFGNPWFGLVGNTNGLGVIDAHSIPPDFSTATFYGWGLGDYQVAAIVSLPFPRVLSPLTRGLDHNQAMPFACPSPMLAGQIFYGGSQTGELATYTGWEQATCPLPTGNRNVLPAASPIIRGISVERMF